MFSGSQKDREKLQKSFGKHLKKVLTQKGIKSAELARRSFIDRQHISAIINGKMNPTLYKLSVICKALEMSFEEFFEGYEE